MSEQPLHPPAPKLLARVSAALRTRHRSRRTEEAYVGWIRRFILFHRKRHPDEMGHAEVAAFLSHLAVDGQVSASTQNQALCALLFLYRDVLQKPVGHLEGEKLRATEQELCEIGAELGSLRGRIDRRAA